MNNQEVYDSKTPLQNKFLQADGSITTKDGNVIAGANSSRAELYTAARAFPNKWMQSDGSITDGISLSNVYPSASDFPVTGTIGFEYVDSTTGIRYVWNGTAYQPLPQATPSGGYVDSFDFGTASPTQAQITQQVASDIWAPGTLDSSNADATQWTFTETASGMVHSVMDIFDGTRIINLFHDDGTGASDGTGTDLWRVAVSASTTPPVFSWAHIGQEVRAAQIVISGQPYSGQITFEPY